MPNLSTPANASQSATTCKSCGEPIRFERQPSGKWMPVELSSGESHFAHCPAAASWRRRDAPRASSEKAG